MSIDNRVQLKTGVMFASYKQACDAGKTFAEWYKEDIEPSYNITEDSLSSKLSTEKRNLEIANTVFDYNGEEMTGQELVALVENGERVFKTLRDVAKACESVVPVDMSEFPTLKNSGRGRGGESLDRTSILTDLIGG